MDDTSRGIAAEQVSGRPIGGSGDRSNSSSWSSGNRYAAESDERATDSRAGEDVSTDKRTGQIRNDIEQARIEMSETINALEEKLQPGRLMSDATARVKTAATEKVRDMADSASDTAQDVMDYTWDAADTVASTVRNNPIPAAMVGIGAAWWLMSQNQTRRSSPDTYRRREGSTHRDAQRSRYGISQGEQPRAYRRDVDNGDGDGVIDRLISNPIPTAMATAGLTWLALSGRTEAAPGYGGHSLWSEPNGRIQRGENRSADSQRTERGTLESMTESAEQLTHRTKEYAADVASTVERYADDMTSAVRTSGRQAQNQLQRLISTNPFLVGVGALAIGAAIGVMAPETDSENEWMGEARETVLDRAEDMARTAVSQVQDAAGEMAGEIASRMISGDKS